jgi:hypothetical protein
MTRAERPKFSGDPTVAREIRNLFFNSCDGALTDISVRRAHAAREGDFQMYVLTPGASVRFFSYLGADFVLGAAQDSRDHYYKTALKHLSNGNNNHTTTFIIEAAEQDCFRLKWAQNPKTYLTWNSHTQKLILSDYIGYRVGGIGTNAEVSLFRVDAVKDGNWFALNNLQRQSVLDLSGSITAENNPVISWQWNGGDNQIWRTEAVA